MKNHYTEKQLNQGMNVEKEHSKNSYVQKKIAKDHLKENKDYYKYSDNGGKGKEYLVAKSNKNNFC